MKAVSTAYWRKMDNELTQLELIQLAGKYLTYEEFIKDGHEGFVCKTEWYRILEGDTATRNKMGLKRAYDSQFQDDWNTIRAQAKDLLKQRN